MTCIWREFRQFLNVVAERSGHTANVAAAQKLAESVTIERVSS